MSYFFIFILLFSSSPKAEIKRAWTGKPVKNIEISDTSVLPNKNNIIQKTKKSLVKNNKHRCLVKKTKNSKDSSSDAKRISSATNHKSFKSATNVKFSKSKIQQAFKRYNKQYTSIKFPSKAGACYKFLKQHNIKYKKSRPVYGIAYPVLVYGKIGGIAYVNKWDHKSPMLVDCRYVYSLLKIAPVLKRLKVTTVYYSNTYRRPRRAYSASHHGRGLAMDITALQNSKLEKANIYKDWRKVYGTPLNCIGNVKSPKARLLRTFVCEAEKIGAFHLALTPDSDAAHQDHIHASGPPQPRGFKRYRYAGRYFDQPLPGEKDFARWWKWYICYRVKNSRRRSRCWARRLKNKPKGYEVSRPVSKFVNIPFDKKKFFLKLH